MNNPLQNSLDKVIHPELKRGFITILLALVVIGLSACQPAPVHLSKNPFCQQPTNTNDDCSFALDEATVWLSSSDTSMPIEQGVRLTLTSSVPLHQVSGEIRGVSMYMGRLPVVWEQESESVWHADVLLGACTDPKMVWELRLQMEAKAGAGSVPSATAPWSLRIPFQSSIPNS